MKSILMTTSAVILVTGVAAGQAQAACPEDIDAFDREYEQALQNAAASEALSTSEQAQLFGLRTAAENLHTAGNAEMCAAVIDRANLMLESTIAPQVIRPDELIGREVRNAQDEDLGEIEEVMLDPISGRIAYVVVEHGGFLGIGDDLFAVPWAAMQFMPGDDQTLLLDIPEDKLENAPRFSRDDETPLERREWVTSVHSYYGVQPYWQDEIGTMVMQYGSGAAGAPPAAAGAAGQGGEVKTIVVPITTPGGQQQPQSETPSQDSGTKPEQTDQESGAGAESGNEADAGSPAGQQTGAANLAAPQPEADTAQDASADLEAMAARMDELEQRVEELSRKDTEVEQSISALEQQTQQLSEQVPGEEVTQAIDRLEEQVAALEEAGQAAGEGTSGNAGQGASVIVVPGPSGGSGEGSGQGAQQGGQSDGSAAAGQSGAAATAQPDTDQQNQQEDEAVGEQQGQPAEQQGQSGEQQGQAGGQQGQAGEQLGQSGEQQGQQDAAAQGTAASTPSAAGEPASQPCEEQIARLEEDLKRAEELGLTIGEAQSELKEAQAMLNNNSEALCSAAIKRAHEELVAVGFEPTQSN